MLLDESDELVTLETLVRVVLELELVLKLLEEFVDLLLAVDMLELVEVELLEVLV